MDAAAVDPVVASQVAEIGKYGLLGAFLILSGMLNWRQQNKIEALNLQLLAVTREYATLAQSVVTALDRSADAAEERNRVIERLSDSMNRSAEATRAQMSLAEVQTNRIMDRMGVTDRVVDTLAAQGRVLDDKVSSFGLKLRGLSG